MPKLITFITSNANKLAEVRSILSDDGHNDNGDAGTTDAGPAAGMRIGDGDEVVRLESRNLDLVEIQAKDVIEVARDKCVRAGMIVDGPVLTEDTSLEFDALNGLPGPYIKYFLASLGHHGLNNLLAAYPDNKSADAVCTFALSLAKGSEPLIFQGRTTGRIVQARGPGDFGWDPIFEYKGETYAEMDKVAKNRISHRYKALQKLKVWLGENTSSITSTPAELS